MTLYILIPTTPGQRGTVLVSKSHLWKGEPHKSLVKPKNSSGDLDQNPDQGDEGGTGFDPDQAVPGKMDPMPQKPEENPCFHTQKHWEKEM